MLVNKEPASLPSCFRYASLAFAKNSNAKMAVKEMNGVKINGKSVTVRLVKIPGEYTPPPLSTTGNSTSMNHLEKNTNKDASQGSWNLSKTVSFLPWTRLVFLMDEQWSWVCHTAGMSW